MIWYTPSAHAIALTSINITTTMGMLLPWLMSLGYVLIGNNQALLLFVEEATLHV